MSSARLSKKAVIISGVALIAVIPVFAYFGRIFRKDEVFSNNPTAQSVESIPPVIHPSAEPPIRLKIPKLNVDALIEDVGLTADGSMAVPKGPDDVAWFALGPRPGEIGNAVIAGHEGWKNGISAVFDYLYTLHVGDTLYTVDAKGKTTVFVVREIRILDEHADASAVFASSDGKAHLNLVTCEGVWNATTKSYAGRLVVFADEENHQ
jgi:LPXTG-site transpeptidase (sortase) family protein